MMKHIVGVYRQDLENALTLVSQGENETALQPVPPFILTMPSDSSRSAKGEYLLSLSDEWLGQDLGTDFANASKSFIVSSISHSTVAMCVHAEAIDLGLIRVRTFDKDGNLVDLDGQIVISIYIQSI